MQAITSAESNRAAIRHVGMIGEANLCLCLAASEGLPLKGATAKADAITHMSEARRKAMQERRARDARVRPVAAHLLRIATSESPPQNCNRHL